MTDTKMCPSCSEEKAVDEFGRNKTNKDGLSWYCKPCNRAKHKAHRDENKDVIRKRKSVFYYKNQEAILASHKRWYLNNRDKELKRVKDYYEGNKEVVREYKRVYLQENRLKEYARKGEWAKQNRGLYMAAKARRRAKKLSATPAWVNHDAISEIYAQAFNITMETGISHHVDHIVPLQSEIVCGLHWEGNLTVLTARENIVKSNVFWPDMP